MSGYMQVEVEEIVKESDTAFYVRYHDGDHEWLRKDCVANARRYTLGDRDVMLQLLEGTPANGGDRVHGCGQTLVPSLLPRTPGKAERPD